MSWSKWKIVDGALETRTRYLPAEHAFGDLVVKVEALAERRKVDFYARVYLDGVHPHFGEEGWWFDGVAATKRAVREATRRFKHVVKMLHQLRLPTEADLARLRRSYMRMRRTQALKNKGKKRRLKRPSVRRRHWT